MTGSARTSTLTSARGGDTGRPWALDMSPRGPVLGKLRLCLADDSIGQVERDPVVPHGLREVDQRE